MARPTGRTGKVITLGGGKKSSAALGGRRGGTATRDSVRPQGIYGKNLSAGSIPKVKAGGGKKGKSR